MIDVARRPILLGALPAARDGACPPAHLEVDGEDGGMAMMELNDGCTFATELSPEAGEVHIAGTVGGRPVSTSVIVPAEGDPAPVCLLGPCEAVPAVAIVGVIGDAGGPSVAKERRGRGPATSLTYSVRTPQEGYYEEELHRLQHGETGVDVTYIFTRSTPKGFARPPGRIGIRDLETPNRSPDGQPICFVCGPTGFVELVAGTLVTMGYDPGRVKTERFGPSGG